jgi:hypothetical protein
MVITRNYAIKHNIQLQKGLEYRKKNRSQNDETHYIFKFLIFIIILTLIFTTSNIIYNYLFVDKSLYNFIIIDLPEKTITTLYNKIPARPYNYFLDLIQDYNIDYF